MSYDNDETGMVTIQNKHKNLLLFACLVIFHDFLSCADFFPFKFTFSKNLEKYQCQTVWD